MTKRELAIQYVGAFLGVIWKILHPIVLICVFWVIFSVGFKVKPTNGVPFVSWLTAGMAVWFAFADIITGSTHSLVMYSNLIKKTLFPSQILPIIKMIVGIVNHTFFLVILIVLLLFQKLTLNWYNIQFVYYLIGMSALSLGVGLILSSINVFVRDMEQIVPIVLQIGFWATPIFWNLEMLPGRFHIFFKLNPMYYLVEGYRESFVTFKPFWQHPYGTIYFWTLTCSLLIFGCFIFKKLKPHFADAL